MYHELLHDAKALNLDDKAFRVLIDAMCFAAKSPMTLQRKGWLYHNEGFPVSLADFVRSLPMEPDNSPERIQKALDDLCSVGGSKHSFLTWDGKRKAWRVRNWRKWQEGILTEFSQNLAVIPPDSNPNIAAIDLDSDKRQETRKVSASRTPPVGKLTPEQNVVKQAAIDYFYQKLQRHTTLAKPRFPGGQAAKFFSDCIKDEYTETDFREITDWFFDERIKGDFSSANFSHYQAAFNAGCIAVQKRRGA